MIAQLFFSRIFLCSVYFIISTVKQIAAFFYCHLFFGGSFVFFWFVCILFVFFFLIKKFFWVFFLIFIFLLIKPKVFLFILPCFFWQMKVYLCTWSHHRRSETAILLKLGKVLKNYRIKDPVFILLCCNLLWRSKLRDKIPFCSNIESNFFFSLRKYHHFRREKDQGHDWI